MQIFWQCKRLFLVVGTTFSQGLVPKMAWLPLKRKGKPMIRSELLEKLAHENPELKPDEIEKIVDLFFNQITQKLAEGGRIELRGFGAFSTRERKPRIGRNPRTGESVQVPAKRVPYFKPGKEIRERLNKR